MKKTDGLYTYTKTFNIERGVIQGDVLRPAFFIISLDQLVQTYDKGGQGIAVGHIKNLHVLGYVGDAAMCERTL